nr:immunoglobulin light chain junction region [Macaca mulatta]MOW16939.1 immunoglobulin light chain junction region [Macaca mulatta]
DYYCQVWDISYNQHIF